MRVLAIDPGEKRIGVAVSDPTATISQPYTIIKHQSRAIDAITIASLAEEMDVGLIIIGQALDFDNNPTVQSRRAVRLAAAIRARTKITVKLWDESGSTQKAIQLRNTLGVRQKKRREPDDRLAAMFILQDYLDVSKLEK